MDSRTRARSSWCAETRSRMRGRAGAARGGRALFPHGRGWIQQQADLAGKRSYREAERRPAFADPVRVGLFLRALVLAAAGRAVERPPPDTRFFAGLEADGEEGFAALRASEFPFAVLLARAPGF